MDPMQPQLIYCLPFFLASSLILPVALFAFRRRRVRGALYLALVCLAGAIWATFEGMRYLGPGFETNMVVTYLQYLGAAPLSGLALFFALSIFGYERWITPSILRAFAVVMVVMLALIFTDPWHHLVYNIRYVLESGPTPRRIMGRGILWWVFIGYHHALAMALAFLLVRIVLTSTGVMRSQAMVILAAVAVVWAINIIYVSGNAPVPDMDITPLGFILVAISMAWGFFRYNLLDVLPIAKSEIFMGLSNPILVLDDKNRLLDLNPAAAALLNKQATRFIGGNIEQMLTDQPEVAAVLRTGRKSDICLVKEDGEHYFALHHSSLTDRRGARIGRIIIFYDITEHRKAEQAMRERERLQGVLEMAGAVCHDLSQPVMAIMGYVELILEEVAHTDGPAANAAKLTQQAEKLSDMTKKLMGITRYETKRHQGNRIIDIDKASASS